MRTCQPDHLGRVNLEGLVSQGETWVIESTAEDRIQLVRMKPEKRKRKGSLVEYCRQLRELGFTMPDRDQSPISTTPID